LTLSVECVGGMNFSETCKRIIEISEDDSLNDLHDVIQNAVDFDRDHAYEFYLANSPSPWAKKHWITAKEEWEDKEDDFECIKLKDILPLARKKLYYLFDFGDQWIFEIRKARRLKSPEDGVSYPRLIKRIGPNPEQYPGTE